MLFVTEMCHTHSFSFEKDIVMPMWNIEDLFVQPFWWNILKTLKKMSDETSIVICKVMSNLSKFEEFPFKI
jgi:hypothetical protein